MGLIRRALIPIASWSSFDPLLILGPSITIILALSLFWELKSQQSLGEEKPDKLMVALFLFGCVQMFNPYSGSPISGFVAAIYIIVPWLWYFIAFYKIKQKDIVRILNIVEVIGTMIALYGIYQTFFGILPFEQMWVDLTGYAALYLAEDTVRAIGTFPSAQEFVYFTMITFMIGFTKLIYKKILYYIYLWCWLPYYLSSSLVQERLFFYSNCNFYCFDRNEKNVNKKNYYRNHKYYSFLYDLDDLTQFKPCVVRSCRTSCFPYG